MVQTAPRLPDGTPFPTLYYLTCPKAAAAVSRLEAGGVMRAMTERLRTDPELRGATRPRTRTTWTAGPRPARAAGLEPLPATAASAGGMPDRVKCLHALVAHELAVPGSNPLGREALEAAGPWWAAGPCVADADLDADLGADLDADHGTTDLAGRRRADRRAARWTDRRTAVRGSGPGR